MQVRAGRSDSENAILAQIQEQLSSTYNLYHGLASVSALALVAVPEACEHLDEGVSSGRVAPLTAYRKASRGDHSPGRRKSSTLDKGARRKGSRGDPSPTGRKSATMGKAAKKELKQAKKTHSKYKPKKTKVKSKNVESSSSST